MTPSAIPPKAGMAETAKAIVRHPRFPPRFFGNLAETFPPANEAPGRADKNRAAALQTVLLAMIDHAAGAPGAARRLKALANGPERVACALAPDTANGWAASVVKSAGELDPTLSPETRERLATMFTAQVTRMLALVETP